MSNTDPELYFADDGAPRSGRFGDIYYSLQDGLNESRAVFLTGCHMPDIWTGRADFSLLELGFGTGLNIAAVMQLWAQTRTPGAHLHIFSVEGFLMSATDASQALRSWPELAEFTDAILSQWPKARQGFHYMDFPQWGVSVMLGLMDVRAALDAWSGRADAIFLDGFSPALNADMWADDVLVRIAGKAQPGTRLATFTVAGFVRRGLQAVGFEIFKMPGYDHERERLEAVLGGDAGRVPASPKKIAVVGAGIAGCALVHQAQLLGIEVDLFEAATPGAGASGNAAALVTPRLDAGGNAISALFADAFAYAGSLYRRLCPQAIIGKGVYQCAATDRDGMRFDKIVVQPNFAADDLRLFAAGDNADAPEASGLYLATALSIRPETVLAALLGDCFPIGQQVIDVTATTVHTAEQVFSGYDAVVLTCGEGILDIDAHGLRLQAVRGQVEQVAMADCPQNALSWGGYAIPFDGDFLFGATHLRDDRGSDIRVEDVAYNIATLARLIPECAEQAADLPSRSRASVRITTTDYMPAMGQTVSGVWVMTGLGARGFCLAPLLAKALLTDMTGLTSSLQIMAAKLIDCRRFSV